MHLAHADNLTKNYPGFTLGPVDMQMETGEVLGVLGPNGAGKTTLLKLVWGFLRPDKDPFPYFTSNPI